MKRTHPIRGNAPWRVPFYFHLTPQHSVLLYPALDHQFEQVLAAYIDYQGKATNVVLTLRRSDAMVPKSVQHVVSCHHDIHTERIMQYLHLTDTPLIRAALSSWLSFVAEMARYANEHSDITRNQVVRLCINALESIVGAVTEEHNKGQGDNLTHDKSFIRDHRRRPLDAQ